jgi:hypothetical protein
MGSLLMHMPQRVRQAASSDSLRLSLTIVVTFAISFGVMWRGRPSAQVAEQVRGQSTNAEPSVQRSAPGPVLAMQPGQISQMGAVPAARPQSATDSQGIEEPTSNYDGAELPVVFNVVKTTAYVSDDAHDGVKVSKDVNEAIIFNSSEKSLDITVTEVNLPTMESSLIEFSLAKGNQKHFGVTQGLKMLSGDQITVRSPTYRDITQLIP